MLNDTITVYNKYAEAGTEKWQRTVFVRSFLERHQGRCSAPDRRKLC
jgi:hypothetical protein